MDAQMVVRSLSWGIFRQPETTTLLPMIREYEKDILPEPARK